MKNQQTTPVALILPIVVREYSRLDDYFGVWAVHEDRFIQTLNAIRTLDIAAHVSSGIKAFDEGPRPKAENGPPYRTIMTPKGTIAHFDIVGHMMKASSSFGGSTSTVVVRRAIDLARTDSEIKGARFRFETPGGTVAGTDEFAQSIAKFSQAKPSIVEVEDICASAGVWGASMARKIIINKAGIYGSIGTLLVVHDYSKMADKEGITVHVLKRGQFKGTGVPGTQITSDQLAELDKIVGNFDTMFKTAVSKSRKISMETINSFEARVYPADEAVSNGLVDAVGTSEDALAMLIDMIPSSSAPKVRSKSMDYSQPATITDLKKMCPGSTAEFREEQVEKGATLGDSMQTWMEIQEKRRVEAEEKSAKLEKDQKTAETASPKLSGTKGVKETTNGDSSPDESDFSALVLQYMRDNPSVSRKDAIVKIAVKYPAAHQAFVLEQRGNDRKSIKMKIEERFDEATKLEQSAEKERVEAATRRKKS